MPAPGIGECNLGGGVHAVGRGGARRVVVQGGHCAAGGGLLLGGVAGGRAGGVGGPVEVRARCRGVRGVRVEHFLPHSARRQLKTPLSIRLSNPAF